MTHSVDGERAATAQRHSQALRARTARLAETIAGTESHAAALYERMAAEREGHSPERAQRLREMSTHAREFAATERDVGRQR